MSEVKYLLSSPSPTAHPIERIVTTYVVRGLARSGVGLLPELIVDNVN